MPANEDPAAEPEANRLIADRYRLEQRIGGGAMGIVWAGTDELLRRPVAVKEVLLPSGMPEEEAAELRERALREARAVALVTHPNVVTLYDVAREDGEPFVVMELVPSQSLAALVSEHGALGDPQLAVVADGVAAGLEAAHKAGIVHRDVKPGNVLIGDDGRIKLSDFGIARNISERTLTSSGIMLGTPAFIAPEVASGEPVTAAADLWGLGAALYAAAEGEPPYDTEDDPVATITEVVRGPVPQPSRGGEIGALISALMVKDPAARIAPTEVRRRVQHLLPEAGSRPFEMLLDPDAPTVKVRTPTRPRQEQPPPAPSEPAPLAADPGPLPFTPREEPPAPPPRRRSRWGAVALAFTGVLVFALVTAGAFAGTRVLAGQPPLPQSPSGQPGRAAPQLVRYVAEVGDGGSFSVRAPAGYEMFRSIRQEPAKSSLVHLVSPDGGTEIAVERFRNYYRQGHDEQDYLDELPHRATGGHGSAQLQRDRITGAPGPAGGEAPRRIDYAATQQGVLGGTPQNRVAAEWLLPKNGDLWVLRLTLPQQRAHERDAMFDDLREFFRTPA